MMGMLCYTYTVQCYVTHRPIQLCYTYTHILCVGCLKKLQVSPVLTTGHLHFVSISHQALKNFSKLPEKLKITELATPINRTCIFESKHAICTFLFFVVHCQSSFIFILTICFISVLLESEPVVKLVLPVGSVVGVLVYMDVKALHNRCFQLCSVNEHKR